MGKLITTFENSERNGGAFFETFCVLFVIFEKPWNAANDF